MKWNTKTGSSLLGTMENTCSFLSIVGGQCGHDRRDRNRAKECIPLLSCQRDVTGHKAMFAFHGIDNEVELILARASIFFSPQNIDQMTVCSAHRASLGIEWTRRVPDKCKVPLILSHHSEDISKRPKADSGLLCSAKRNWSFSCCGSGLYSLKYKYQHCCFSWRKCQ